MKVIQLVPELESGGVERGTLEIAAHLVREGQSSLVISNGGRLVPSLETSGTRHLTLPIHRKSPASLLLVPQLRRIFETEKPDLIHPRSRVPAWLAWLAWRGMDPLTRPRFITTVHGFYSVNPYSRIMTRGERVIAVSSSVRNYILENYPKTPPDRIHVIHRGASPQEFPRNYTPPINWLTSWNQQHPHLAAKSLLLLPGRITRWKGHEDFLHLIASLIRQNLPVHGLIAGDTHPKKRAYGDELRQLADSLHLHPHLTFLGHRSDIREVMAISSIVYSLSRQPEAFGRVSLEAMSLGKPVIGYHHGGVGEQLAALYPIGAIPLGDATTLATRTTELLTHAPSPAPITPPFTQEAMTQSTLALYRDLLASPR